jgi:serine phosphatase RsbU (regulator of sigma subunit)
MTPPGRHDGIVECGAAGFALEGNESGDVHVVAGFPGGVLLAVIDGLGHGPEAATAANAAARILQAFASEPIDALLERCHEGLRRTRGAVVSLASFDAASSAMTWSGVGNVEGFLVRADAGAAPRRETITLRGGIVGYQLPSLRVSAVQVSHGDMLVLATDGLRSGFADRLPAGSPQEIADALLARHARRSDDALVLVARYVGAP